MGLLAAGLGAWGCSSDSSPATTGTGGSGGSTGSGGSGGSTGSGGSGGTGAQTLYQKYGGAPTVRAIVDDAAAGLLGDCQVAPYFAVVGMPNHDSAERLKSCLRLQFTVLMGGPGSYPGVNDQGETCVSMTAIHQTSDLHIPSDVFDKFIADLGGVLEAKQVASADITTIAGALVGLKSQVVSAAPVQMSACDGGVADAAAGQ